MNPALVLSVDVPANPEAIWSAWTDGAKSPAFFAPENRVEPRVGGAFEQYFMLDGEPGQRGSEGCVFTRLEAPRRLGFTWNFPPHLPIRGEHTLVEVDIAPGADGCRVTLTQTGWREGPGWAEGYAYFERAWRMVLDNLRAAFAEGRL